MEDREDQELEALADNYADVRDDRMALTPKEVSAKADLLRAMKRKGRKVYKSANVEILIVESEENVKVKRPKPKKDD